MFFTPLTLTILCLQLFNIAVYALPLEKRIVFNPNITSPNEQTVWEVGSQQTVTWDPTGLPDETLTGQAILGYLEGDSINEHLMLDNPLAKGFLIKDGKIQITVPNVPERDGYIVVVFGDSGNASPRFTIKGGSGNATSSTAAPSTTAVPSSTVAAPPTISTVPGTPGSPTTTGITLTVTSGTTPPATAPPTTVATATPTSPVSTVTAPTSAPLSSSAPSVVLPSTVTDTAGSQGTQTPAAANAPANAALAMHMSFELTLSVIATTTVLLFIAC